MDSDSEVVQQHRLPRLVGALALTLAVLAAAAPAAAEPTVGDREQARGLMDLGREKYAAEDYAGALKAYKAADDIMGVPTTSLAVGEAQAALGLLMEARDRLLTVARSDVVTGEPTPYAKARERARMLARALAERIPSVQVDVRLPNGQLASHGIRVSIGGTVLDDHTFNLPLRTNPGEVAVRADVEGYGAAKRTVKVEEGERHVVSLVVRDFSASGGMLENLSPLVWIGFGFAVAGSVAGAAMGAAALSKSAALKDDCPDDICPAAKQESMDTMRTFAHVSTISFAIAGTGLAVGILGLVLSGPDSDPEDDAGLTPLLGPGWVGMRGRF